MHLDSAFFPALLRWSSSVGVPPNWGLLIFYLESGLNPAARNAFGYEGLNQIHESYLRRFFGIDPVAYLSFTATEQLTRVAGPWLAREIRDNLGRAPRSVGSLYALNFWPAGVRAHGDGPSSVLVRANSSDPHEQRAYQANRGLDFNHDGTITISDLDLLFERISKQPAYQAAERMLLATQPGPSSMKLIGWAIAGLLAGAGGFVAWRERHRLPWLS